MRVQCYAYDLTRGMAAAMSPMLLGHRIEGVWHTSIVVDGRDEWFFGHGVHKARAGATMFGQPHHIIELGDSEVTPDMLAELLADLQPRYGPDAYALLTHNCTHFANELAELLTGNALPDYIMNQADYLFSTPWGQALMPLVLQMEGVTGAATASGLAPAPPAQAGAQPSSSAAAPAAAATAPAAAATAAAEQRAASRPGPTSSAAAAEQAAAAANACMARTASEAGGGSAGPEEAAAAVDKATAGVAGLDIQADARSPRAAATPPQS